MARDEQRFKDAQLTHSNGVNREYFYKKEADPLFQKWKRGDATEQQWLDKIQEIKTRLPYAGGFDIDSAYQHIMDNIDG